MDRAEYFGRAKHLVVSTFAVLNPRQARTYVLATPDATTKLAVLVTPQVVNFVREGPWFVVFNQGPGSIAVIKAGGQPVGTIAQNEVGDLVLWDRKAQFGNWILTKRTFVTGGA